VIFSAGIKQILINLLAGVSIIPLKLDSGLYLSPKNGGMYFPGYQCRTRSIRIE